MEHLKMDSPRVQLIEVILKFMMDNDLTCEVLDEAVSEIKEHYRKNATIKCGQHMG